MRSFSWRRPLQCTLSVMATLAGFHAARAQSAPQGFAVERLYPSAPGGGWIVMDSLAMRGEIGGAVALTTGYAMKPLRVTDGIRHLAVVSDQAFTNFAFAVTYRRWRVYLNLEMPLLIRGQSGTVGAYHFNAPSVDLGATPDSLSDPRIGVDVRLFGDAKDPFRLGIGGQLFVPNVHNGLNPPNPRIDYNTDGTFRAMGRLLIAGEAGAFTYAAQLGFHLRPLDDSPTPGSPQGSELLFGAAAGPRIPIGKGGALHLIVGPELFGASALSAMFGSATTGLEMMLSARVEDAAEDPSRLRVKLGAGAGIDRHFGTPEWRILLGIEVSDRLAAGP